jgi:RNA polymerase sigma-70 factor (ECF subfamily)
MLSDTDADDVLDTDTETSDDDMFETGHMRLVRDDERPVPETLSFEEVCLTYRDEMVSYAHKLTGNRDRAEDVVQDSMIRALNAWDRWVPDGEPMMAARAWLYRIVANTFVKSYRRNQRYSAAVERDRESIATFTSADGDEYATWLQLGNEQERGADAEMSDEVRDAIASLHPHHREIIECVYIQEMAPQQAAEHLGISMGTMWSRLSRARANLGRLLKRFARDNYSFASLAVEPPSSKTAETDESDEAPRAVAVG